MGLKIDFSERPSVPAGVWPAAAAVASATPAASVASAASAASVASAAPAAPVERRRSVGWTAAVRRTERIGLETRRPRAGNCGQNLF